jgi:hypothetical protein
MNSSRVHVTYIIGILVSIIILLLTVKWAAIPDLVAYITFALTLTSLVLALLAIVYAFFSSASAGQQIATLRNASDELSRTAGAIGASAAELQNRVASIPPLFEEVGNKVSQTRDLVELLTKQGAANEPAAIAKPIPKSSAPADTFAQFVARSSTAGTLLLYAVAVAFERKAAFSLKDLVAKVPFTDYDYLFGYLVACHASGIVTTTTTKGIWNVIEMDSGLSSAVKSAVQAMASAKGDAGSSIQKFASQYTEIDKYFAAPSPAAPVV